MGFFSKFFGKTSEEVKVYGDISAGGLSSEEALELQEHFQSILVSDDKHGKLNAVHKMLAAGMYEECIAAYITLAEEYPDEKGDCFGQIGAAYYFLGDFEKAISFYSEAKEHGADEWMMDENIKEAQEALASN